MPTRRYHAYHHISPDKRTTIVEQFLHYQWDIDFIAQINDVDPRTVRTYISRVNLHNTVLSPTEFNAYGSTCGRPSKVTLYDITVILDIIENDCSLYAYEIREMLILRGGTTVSDSTIRYWLHKLGFSHKKVWKYARRARLIQEIAYWEYLSQQQYHVNQLVFFDESSVNKRNSNRRYGWSQR